jgi:hypothetical protein
VGPEPNDDIDFRRQAIAGKSSPNRDEQRARENDPPGQLLRPENPPKTGVGGPRRAAAWHRPGVARRAAVSTASLSLLSAAFLSEDWSHAKDLPRADPVEQVGEQIEGEE